MEFVEQLPEWLEVGTEPPLSKKTNGWQPEDKPPASYFNWLFNRAYKSILELRDKIASVDIAGSSNADVKNIKSILLETDTRTTVPTYTSGKLTKVEEKDGSTVIRSTVLTYDGNGKLTTKAETAGGKTVTTTITYDANGKFSGKTKAVT